jgi:hypothetical protein
MHIPPTLFYFQSLDDFWKDTYKQQFLSLLTTYQSKIVAILGAHIHQADITAPMSTAHPGFTLPMFLTPSASPIFMNNPGYSMVNIDQSINDVQWRFFQLYEYSLSRSVSSSFITVLPEKMFNVKFADGESVK